MLKCSILTALLKDNFSDSGLQSTTARPSHCLLSHFHSCGIQYLSMGDGCQKIHPFSSLLRAGQTYPKTIGLFLSKGSNMANFGQKMAKNHRLKIQTFGRGVSKGPVIKMTFFVEPLCEVQFLALQVHWDPISERSHNKNGHGEIFRPFSAETMNSN